MKKINFYLILLIVFALPSYLVRFSIFGVPTTLLEVLIYISFFLTIVNYISVKLKTQSVKQQFKIQSIIQKDLLPVILFVITGIIGIIVSPDKNVALGQFKAFIFDPILFFITLIINSQLSNQKTSTPQHPYHSTPLNLYTFKPIFQALILSGVFVAIYAIYQKITGDVTIDGRVIGIFGYSPNYLSMYLTPIAVLTAGYLMMSLQLSSSSRSDYSIGTTSGIQKKPVCRQGRLDSRRNLSRLFYRNGKDIMFWIYGTAFILMFIAIYFSGSRAGLAVTFVSISLLLILKCWDWIKKRKIVSMFLCFYVVLLLVAGWWFIKPNWQLSAETGGRIISSNNVRWQIWDTSGKMLATDHNWLWGVGLGNYQNYFSNYTKGWVNFNEYISPNALTAHNLYLQTWFNLGLLGIISFIWLIVLFFRYSLFAIRNSKLVTCYLLLVAMFFSILLYGIIESTYWKNDLSVMFWFLIALSQINLSSLKIKK